MRKTTENQGNARALGEYFSPKSKVKDLAPRSLPQSFHPETPMKPSQVPNRISHPPPRRVLPLQTPEMCYKDRPGPRWHPPHPPGPIYSTVLVPGSTANFGNSVNSPPPMARDKLGSLQHSAQPGPGPICSPLVVPFSRTNVDTSLNRPQPSHPHLFPPAPPHFISNGSPLTFNKKGPMTESKGTLSNSGTQNQESKQAQSNDVRSSTPTVELHRPRIGFKISPLHTRAAPALKPPPTSGSERSRPDVTRRPSWGYQPLNTQSPDRSGGYSLPFTHGTAAPCQSQQHVRTPTSESEHKSTVDLNRSSQKRCKEFERCYENAKKPCLQGTNSHVTQTAKPTVQSNSVVSPPSSKITSVLGLSPKTTGSHLGKEPACGQSPCLEPSSIFKPTQSCYTSSSSPKHCTSRPPSMGAKQVFLNAAQNHKVEIKEIKLPSKSIEENVQKRSEENHKKDKPSTLLPSKCPHKDSRRSPHTEVNSHHSGHTVCGTTGFSVKPLSRSNQVGESRKLDRSTPKPTSKPNSGSSSSRTGERKKSSHARRPVVILDDAADLFTPDPLTYVVNPACRSTKPKGDGETIKSPTSEKSCVSSPSSSSGTLLSGSPYYKTQNSTVNGSPHATSSSSHIPQVCLPTITLKRVKLENVPVKGKELKNSPISSSGRQLKNESVKSENKHTSPLFNNVSSCETDASPSEQTSTSHWRRASEMDRKQVNEEDPIDVELDLGLSFALGEDGSLSSHSSEEEQLISLQEIMERAAKPPETPEKGAFSEPSTPGHPTCQLKNLPLPSSTKSGIYKNNLDQMLTEINNSKKAKEIEQQLLNACNEDLLRIAEYEEAEENREEGISTEQQEFLQRFSLMSSAIREVPPGEVVFNLEKFGRIFDQDTLQLRQCMVNPQGIAQKTLLWSSPAQLRLHLNIGLFQEAYNCNSPCPTQVTCFLFKMMSVHSERMVSEKILQVLCDIACTAAYQIVKNGSQQFEVWVPSLSDVTLVLMNMGVAFVTLYPFENLQPSFTEGDLLEDVYIKSESPSSKEEIAFPEHNCNSILKYLSYCMGLCPRAYSDEELLLLLTVVGRVGLDTRLILQSTVELYPLHYKIVNNFREWDTMLPRICLALTNLTDDHHNMCLLVQLLPDNTRGKQLRRHLSMSMISKLLDGNCTYRPTQNEFQLSELRPYVPRMQPSTLFRSMLRSQKDKEEDTATLDQQSYYLCYSLLTLANEASNFHFFPAHQKGQLLFLSSELNAHVKCDIRESEKCLYRSKVKDLVARIDTKWQMLLQRTRPLDGRLYDYWQPVDTLISSQEDEDDEEDTVIEDETMMEEEEEDADVSGETDVAMVDEKEQEEKEAERVEAEEEVMVDDEKLAEMEGQECTTNATSKTEDATQSVPCDLNQVMPEVEPEVPKEPQAEDEQIDAGNAAHADVEGEMV
ncbi:SMC5-SMC6 complex localization factor protein 2 [Stegastes partitus]|uniref:Protein FAM178A-like n=1 Tax=Stegastes partitus TaxID=144197 RepID=A0A3B5AKK0_9TELE|nr:PREDICTED: protein FAM178A-like [Stegastes partitus]